jgi:hypothetical protein
MEITPSLSASLDVISCENCKASNPIDRKFCSQCSYPIAGTDQDRINFRVTVARNKKLLKDSEDKIKSAKTIIYILSGLFFLAGVVAFLQQENFELLIVNLVICLLYLIFAAWSSANPFGAILTAFIVYITVQVVNAFLDPTSIGSGIILKVVFIVAFVKGIRSALEARSFMRELQKLNATPVGSD